MTKTGGKLGEIKTSNTKLRQIKGVQAINIKLHIKHKKTKIKR